MGVSRGTLSLGLAKKAVSVYGLGRFPVTLYHEQWIRLLDETPDLRAFLEENKSKLKLKRRARAFLEENKSKLKLKQTG